MRPTIVLLVQWFQRLGSARGEVDPDRLTGRNKRIGEAETLLLAGQELLEQSTSIESKYKRDSLKRLVRLYTAWPKATGAAEWKRKLETFDQSATENAAQSTGKAY